MVYLVPYKYIKDESHDPIYSHYDRRFVLGTRLIPLTFIALGLIVFATQVAMPFIYIKNNQSTSKAVTGSVLGTATGFKDFQFQELQVGNVSPEEPANVPVYFYLTVEKLGIHNFKVETNPQDLNPDLALGRYPGSGLPDRMGTDVFIYGHSVLPIFYNPQDPLRVFSTLDRLEAGDELILDYNNREYRYIVELLEVKKPSDVNPLEEFKPAYLNQSTLTLMTCTPPGSKVMRLLVRAVIVD